MIAPQTLQMPQSPGVPTEGAPKRKRALVIYGREPLGKECGSACPLCVPVPEYGPIVSVLLASGFDVDCIAGEDWPLPAHDEKPYELVWDLCGCLPRFAKRYPSAVKVFLTTEPYAPFRQNRKPGILARFDRSSGDAATACHLADRCLLAGDEWMLSTYPEELRKKTTLANAVVVDKEPSSVEIESGIESRGFLLLAGRGARHVLSDVLFEVFARHPDWRLHVVGTLSQEKRPWNAGVNSRGRRISAFTEFCIPTPINSNAFVAPVSRLFFPREPAACPPLRRRGLRWDCTPSSRVKAAFSCLKMSVNIWKRVRSTNWNKRARRLLLSRARFSPAKPKRCLRWRAAGTVGIPSTPPCVLLSIHSAFPAMTGNLFKIRLAPDGGLW